MAAGLRPRPRLDLPTDGMAPIFADGTTVPPVLADAPPEPVPTALPAGLRPQVALDLPVRGPAPAPIVAPGSTAPAFLTEPPTESSPDNETTPPPVSPEPTQPTQPPASAAGVPSAVKTETEQVVLSPQQKAALARGERLSTQQDAQADKLAEAKKTQTGAQAALEHDTNRLDSLIKQDQALVQEQNAIRQQLAQADYRERDERARQRQEAAQKRVDDAHANAQKDYWADKSTAYKILQGLLTFSSIKSSLALGQDPNDSPFMRMTREAVERDKEKKMLEVRASKEFLEAARRGPEEARQFLLDARADIDAGTARQLQITLAKGEALKASRKVDANVLQANIAAANAEQEAKLLESRQQMVDRDLQRGAPSNRKVTTTQVPLTAEQMKAAREATGQDPREVRDPKTGQTIGLAPTPKEGQDSRTSYETLLAFRDVKERIAKFVADNGTRFKEWNPETKNAYIALTTEGAGYLTTLNNTGVLNEGEYKRYTQALDPDSLLSSQSGVQRGLNTIMVGVETRYASKVKSLVPTWKPATGAGTSAGGADLSNKSDAELQAALNIAAKDPKFKALVPGLTAELRRRKGK
jgi:hypothetical protein